MKNPVRTIGFSVIAILIVVSGLLTVKTDSRANFLETFGLFLAAWLTFCVLSFLYRDNPFYKAAEHIMVGLAMGYFTIFYIFQVIVPRWWDRFYHGDLRPTDVLFGSPEAFRYALVIPAILGLLMLTRISSKWGWLSRWSIATTIGISSGIAIPAMLDARFMKQIRTGVELPIEYLQALRGTAETMPGFTDVPLWQIGVPILMVGTLCALTYFFFSVPHRGLIGYSASAGIWILMIGFGASFGYTVMARLSLFIGRVLFIVDEWLDLLPAG